MATKGWAIELLGEQTTLENIASSLSDDFYPRIEIYSDPAGDHFLLRDPEFDQIADANGIRTTGMLFLTDILGAWAARNRALASVTTGAIFQFDENGGINSHHVIAEGSAGGIGIVTGFATITVHGPDGKPLPAPPPQPSSVQQLHALAKQYEPIRVLLRSTGQAADWIEIYKIYESARAISKLLGSPKLEACLGAEAGRVDYMRWSSHHVRHITVNEPCPAGFGPGVMPIQEARELALWLSDHMLERALQRFVPTV